MKSEFVSKIADIGIPETPTPLASANVGNGDPPSPLENGDVLNGWSLKSKSIFLELQLNKHFRVQEVLFNFTLHEEEAL